MCVGWLSIPIYTHGHNIDKSFYCIVIDTYICIDKNCIKYEHELTINVIGWHCSIQLLCISFILNALTKPWSAISKVYLPEAICFHISAPTKCISFKIYQPTFGKVGFWNSILLQNICLTFLRLTDKFNNKHCNIACSH